MSLGDLSPDSFFYLLDYLMCYQQIVFLAPGLMSLVDRSYTYRAVSRGYLEKFQKSYEQIVGHHVAEIHGEERFSQVIQPLLARCFSGELVNSQLWVQLPGGQRRLLEVQQVPVREPDGSISGAAIYTRDITAEKQHEEELHRYERMVSSVNDFMLIVDDQYIVQSVNQSFLRYCQKLRAEAIGEPIAAVVGSEFFYNVLQPRLNRCLKGEEVSSQSWVNLPALGLRFIDARYFPYVVEPGEIAGVVVCIRDITKSKENQAKVVELTTHEAVIAGDFATAARQILEVVTTTLSVERAGIWLFENDLDALRCVELYCCSQRSFAPGPAFRLTDYPGYFQSLSDAWTLEVYDACTDPRTSELAEPYLIPQQIASLLAAPIRISGEIVGVVSCEQVGSLRAWQAADIIFTGEIGHLVAQMMMNHKRKELERKLRQAQKMESLGILAGGIAHDFNNLLVGMLGGVDLALLDLVPDHPARRRLDLIGQSAMRAAELCSQLLAYAGKGQFVRRALNLSELVLSTVRLFAGSLAKNIRLDFALVDDLPAVEVDPTQVRQVIMNLVTNAADAIGALDGGVKIATGQAELPASTGLAPLLPDNVAPGVYVFLEVSDTGCGMDLETQSKMFDPFFTTKFTGRGLGLAAVLGIVRGHQGALSIRSGVGQGTTVRVLLPASYLSSEAETSELELMQEEAYEGLVLVVDDEELVRQVARGILERRGFKVLAAKGGLEAVSLFRDRAGQIDAVLLDVLMPIMDGEQACRELQRIRPEIPVVLSSGFSEADAARRFADLKFDGFLQKPYRAEALVNKIRKAMTRSSRG